MVRLRLHLTPQGRAIHRWTPGFTLVELLVVLGLIALLLAILLPVLAGVTKLGRQTACAAHLRQIGIGVWAYAVDAHGHLPPRYQSPGTFPFDTVRMLRPDGQWVNLGVLTDYLQSPEVFYCPTQTAATSPGLAFDSAVNRWPGSRAGQSPGGPPSVSSVNASFPARAVDSGLPQPPAWTTNNYHNKVIYSDFLGVDNLASAGGPLGGSIQAPHDGEGYNRLFGDGAVAWIRSEPLDELRPITERVPNEQELHEYYQLLDVAP